MKSSRTETSLLAVCLAALAVVALMAGCFTESETSIRKKLDRFLPGELAVLLNGLPQQSWADSTYFVLRTFEPGKKGKYSAKAEADFYILKNVPKCVACKYRYIVSSGMWERYANEWRSYEDSTRVLDRR